MLVLGPVGRPRRRGIVDVATLGPVVRVAAVRLVDRAAIRRVVDVTSLGLVDRAPVAGDGLAIARPAEEPGAPAVVHAGLAIRRQRLVGGAPIGRDDDLAPPVDRPLAV